MALARIDTGNANLTPLQRLALGLDGTGGAGSAGPVATSLSGAGDGGGAGATPPPIPPATLPPSVLPSTGPTIDPNQAAAQAPITSPGPTVDPNQVVQAFGPNGTGAPAAPDAPTAPDTNALEQDPAYQAQKAEDDRLLNQAASGYLSSAKDMLLGFGSQELAKSTLDQLLQDPRIASIFTPADEQAFINSLSDNPDTSQSTLARIRRSQRDNANALDENLNKGNLFYSGTRAKDLGDQAYDFQGQSADARGKIQDALSRISQSYVAAQNAARQGDLSGFQAAYDRALQEALQYGTGTDPTNKVAGSGDGGTTGGQGDVTPKVTAPKSPTAKGSGPAKAPAVKRAPQLISEHGLGQMKKAPAKKKKPAYSGRH